MKKYYKLLAAVLALTMVAVIGVSSVAASAPTGSITVNNAVAGQEYELYRIFDLTGSNPDANGDYQNVAYSIATKWAGFFAAGQPGAGYLVDNPGTNNYPTVAYNGAVKYIALNNDNVADFALAALSYISNVANDGRQTASTTSLTFSGLPLGYYLVYPVGATDNVGQYTSIASLTSTTPNATVVSKATPPTIEKDADDNHVEVGQTVNFTITGQVPNTTGFTKYTYKVSDKMTAGLTFTQAIANLTLKIDGQVVAFNQADGNANGQAKVTAVTWTAADSTANPPVKAGFEFTIDMTEFQDKIGADVEITYSAVVNENAIVAGAENEATLEYNNDPSNDDDTDTDTDIEKLHTSKIVINKVDGDDNTIPLEGAEFVLYKNVTTGNTTSKLYYKWNATDGKVEWVDDIDEATVAITDANGIADDFQGLAEGTYYLHETKAPSGYNLLPNDVEVTIDDTSDVNDPVTVTVDVEVENNDGTELPETGGIGTTLFYIVGSLLALGAVITLVTRRRMKESVEE